MPRTHLTLLTGSITFRRSLFALLAAASALLLLPPPGRAQQVRLPSGQGQYAELSSEGPQSHRGDLFTADKNVDLQYAGMRLRSDHLEYNEKTHDAAAQGHIQFDYENEHREAYQAH